jgi:rhodanese-related sulfurtransferase
MNFFKTKLSRCLNAALFALCAAALNSACSEPVNSADRVTLMQARADHEAGKVMLVDIRETREHKTGVAAGAILLPMSELGEKISLIPKETDQPVLLICNTQNRSQATLKKLKQAGYENIRFVEGGMSQWAAQGWPMVAPR